MEKSLVIHIGDHTTGSGRLQRCLAGGHVTVPGREFFYPQVFGADLHHNRLVQELTGKPGGPKPLSKLMHAVAERQADLTVLSAEALEFVDPAKLRDALEAHLPRLGKEARIIAYVRPHAERFAIGYEQQIRLGLLFEDMEAFFDRSLRDRRFFYHGRFKRWSEIFGERFILRPLVTEALRDGDMVSDFLSVALYGQRHELGRLPEDPERHRLSLREVETIARLQRRLRGLRPRVAAQAIGGHASRLMSEMHDPEAPKLELSPGLKLAIAEAYAEDAAAVDADFFEESPLSGALTELGAEARATLEAAEKSPETEPVFGPKEARLLDAWAELAGELAEATPQAWAGHFASAALSFPRPPAPQSPEEMELMREQELAHIKST